MTIKNAITIAMLMKPEEVARALGVGRSKVYQMLNSGELPHIRAGKSLRVPRGALETWILENTVAGERTA